MLANGFKQSTVGAAAGANLALTAIAGYPPLSKKYSTGANGDPIPIAITRDSDGVGVMFGWGHLVDASTLAIDRVTSTWDGTTYNDTNPSAIDLSTGGPYTVSVSLSASLLPLPPIGSDPAISAGTRYLLGAQWTYNPGANSGLSANLAIVTPFRLDMPATVSGVSVKVTAAATTGTMKTLRGAIYRADKNGHIGNLLAESASVSVATTGVKGALFPSSLRLDPGWYFIVLLTDSNVQLAGTNAQGPAGQCPMWGVTGGDPTGRISYATKTITYVDSGPCFPNPFGSGVSFGADWGGSTPSPTLMVTS